MEIKPFVFNPFRVNTYILYDETGECVIIDAACYEEHETGELMNFISRNNLTPKALLNTHGHVDHVCGNIFIQKVFKVPLLMHEKDIFFIDTAIGYGRMFGFDIIQPPQPTRIVADGETFSFGNSSLKIIHAPGHSPGSVMFYSDKESLLITGDVLFEGSIGRTDLEGGSYTAIMNSINSKILVLPPETIVYPGHGGFTTIGKEKKMNPFLQQGF